MANPLDRTWFNTLIDDDGSGSVGTVWDTTQVDGLLDAIDGSLAGLVDLASPQTLANKTLTAPAIVGGLVFPATPAPVVNAYTLDDYREGLWVPMLGALLGHSGQTYVTQNGVFIKIGRKVSASLYLTLATKGTLSGGLFIGGLPFPVDPGFPFGASPLNWIGTEVPFSQMCLVGNPGATWCNLRGARGGGATDSNVDITGADIKDTTAFTATIEYVATT